MKLWNLRISILLVAASMLLGANAKGQMGPMTGRAAGFCAGYPVPGYANPVGGRGMGMGWGRGRGFGRGFGWGRGRGFGRGFGWGRGRGFGRGFGWGRAGYGFPAYGGYPAAYPGGFPAGPTAEQEQQALKQQSEYLQQSLDDINKRIEELEKEKSD